MQTLRCHAQADRRELQGFALRYAEKIFCYLLWGSFGCVSDHVEPNVVAESTAGMGGASLEGQQKPRLHQNSGTAGAPGAQGGGSSANGGNAAQGSSANGGNAAQGAPRDPECNLRGRWLVAQRVLATAIGQEQASNNWFYYEISHRGAELTVTKGLHCGFQVYPKSALAASVDSRGGWPAFLQHNSSTGRSGSFVKEGDGCRLQLAREYVVRGATVDYYTEDPERPLPKAENAADAANPGWEDWDQDDHPGITFNVKTAVGSGTLYVCQRDWTEYNGLTPANAQKFKVAITYGGTQQALGVAPGSVPGIDSASAPSSRKEEHFAWLHELAADQATGTDAQICESIRALKDELVPEANQ